MTAPLPSSAVPSHRATCGRSARRYARLLDGKVRAPSRTKGAAGKHEGALWSAPHAFGVVAGGRLRAHVGGDDGQGRARDARRDMIKNAG